MFTFILLAVIGLFIVFTFLKGKNVPEISNQSDNYKHYVKRNYLMSKAEHEFFKALQESVKDKYYIVPQVQLSKIVEVNHYEHFKRKYFNKIDRKSVDFVLFNKEYFTPYMAIELDDSSHMLPPREIRDDFVGSILERVGIKLIRVPVAKSYDLRRVFSTI
jgi:very-short-patch-repair endonuclease